MSNPYWETNFFQFFAVLAQRIFLFIQGKLSFADLCSDEIQILVLSLAAIAFSFLGTFLVLKKMTMVANSLSHTILLGLVIAYLFVAHFVGSGGGLEQTFSLPVLFLAALLAGVLTTVCTQLLTQVIKIQEDASIGIVFTTLFALGVVAVTIFTRNLHLGLEAVTGNVDALHFDDVKLMFYITSFDLLIFLLVFPQFVMISFDASFAKCIGIKLQFFQYLLMVLVAATVIASFRAIGVLLVLNFLVGPVLAARCFTYRLRKVIAASILIGILCSLCAVALSRHFVTEYQTPLSTSGLVVLMVAIAYIIAIVFSPQSRFFIFQRILKNRIAKKRAL